jgi:K+-sensing histidine kinase KdpD
MEMSPQANPISADHPRKRWIAFLSCLLGLIVLGWVDYMTGYELSLVVFYSGPVGLAAWHAGRWPGLLLAVLAAMACSLADKYDGFSYSNRFYFWWNLGIHFAVFALNAFAASKIRATLRERDSLKREVARLQRTLSSPDESKLPPE